MEICKIKFKAKRIDNGMWIEGLPCENCDKQTCILVLYSKEGGEYGFIPVDPSTVCQFTGLKDKNGKNIWEGDYLKPIYENHKPMKVIYKHGAFCLDTHYRGLEYLPLACCDIRVGVLVELEIVDRRDENEN